MAPHLHKNATPHVLIWDVDELGLHVCAEWRFRPSRSRGWQFDARITNGMTELLKRIINVPITDNGYLQLSIEGTVTVQTKKVVEDWPALRWGADLRGPRSFSGSYQHEYVRYYAILNMKLSNLGYSSMKGTRHGSCLWSVRETVEVGTSWIIPLVEIMPTTVLYATNRFFVPVANSRSESQ